jgi:hypothetical protein
MKPTTVRNKASLRLTGLCIVLLSVLSASVSSPLFAQSADARPIILAVG